MESDEFIGLNDEMNKYSQGEDYEDICFKILEQKLREILLTSAEIRIIGYYLTFYILFTMIIV